MKKVLFLLLSITSTGFAASEQVYVVKSVSCLAGRFNAEKTFAVGTKMTAQEISDLQKETEGSSFIEAGSRASLSLKVSGQNDGICAFNNNETFVTYSLIKK